MLESTQSWYSILSETVYEDNACSPPSSVNGHETNGSVCWSDFTPFIFPKLTDFEIGPEEFPSTHIEFTYILNGSTAGDFERWIDFTLTEHLQVSGVPLAQVTLHYYCTGPPPELQLSDGSNMTPPDPPKIPSCGENATRQRLSFDYNHNTNHVLIFVKRNGGQFYLSEVQFILMSIPGKPYDHHRYAVTKYMCFPFSSFHLL